MVSPGLHRHPGLHQPAHNLMRQLISTAASIFSLLLTTSVFAAPAEIAQSQFCIINATNSVLRMTNISNFQSTDWLGSSPRQMLNASIDANDVGCWPLMMPSKTILGSFTIELNSDQGNIKIKVNQLDAFGALYRPYISTANHTHYHINQKAGDNNGFATNALIVEQAEPVAAPFLSPWMSHIPDSYTLQQIQLIGSHDAAMDYEDTATCTIPRELVMTQQYNLHHQLEHGVRYFDVRLKRSYNWQYYPYHSLYVAGCTSNKPFSTSLNEMIAFVREYPSETIFLKLSHTNGNIASLINLLQQIMTNPDNKDFFYTAKDDPVVWNHHPLKPLRGKIVLLLDCEFWQYLDARQGFFSFSTAPGSGRCNPDAYTQIIYDKYANSKMYDVMESDQLGKLRKYGDSQTQLFLLSWTLTGGVIVSHTPRAAAELVRLSKHKLGQTFARPNIIYYDFEDPGLNKILIQHYLDANHLTGESNSRPESASAQAATLSPTATL